MCVCVMTIVCNNINISNIINIIINDININNNVYY